jgi:hypothetical protein
MSQPFPTFRDALRKISPPWLQRGYAEKLGYAIAIQLDAFGEALDAALRSRFPNVYSAESLPLIGRERRIRRGRNESAPTYAGRLRRWLQDHQRRGGPHAMLAQLRAYFLPLTFPMALWYPSGARYRMDASGNVTRDVVPFTPTTQWARWSLALQSDDLADLTPDELAMLPREWNAAHCLGSVMVLQTGAEVWDYPPEQAWDESGTWDTAEPDVRAEI